MAEEMIYRPREMYETILKKQYHEEAIAYFNELVEKAKVDENLNAMHVKAYNEKVAIRKEKEKKLSGAKTGKVFAIIGLILGIILAVAFIAMSAGGVIAPWGYGIGALGAVLAILMIILLATVIKNHVKAAKAALERAKKEEEEALQVCYNDMAPLNALFDWNMPHRIMKKVTPILSLDENLTAKREHELERYYGLEDDGSSTLALVSGTIMDNPFILEKVFERDIHDKEYTGSLTITWTTTHRDSKGNTYTQTHTQTLYASVYHPAPFFYKNTRLIYGNEAAPDLSFSRQPNPNSKLTGKKLENYVAKRAKELAKMERNAIKKGGSFSAMGNDTFDALFDAIDRDHEVQFRLLFTALAQKNMVDLLTTQEPFGDDFVFVKQKKISSIASGHSQIFDYVASPSRFVHYDCKACRENFVSYCDDFLKNLYFDLAPLISIPLFQTHRPAHSFVDEEYRSFLPRREHEAAANALGDNNFLPPEADPSLPVFLKERGTSKGDGVDSTVIHASSFKTTPMVDYVSKLGGDGRWHEVPVHWIQYDEVHDDFSIATTEVGGSQNDFLHIGENILSRYSTASHYERGILSFFTGKGNANIHKGDFDNLFSK